MQYQDLCSHTSEVLLPNMSDRWARTLNAPGDFSVNILAWNINLYSLPTRLNLSSHGVEIPSILYPVCNEVVESSSHIFSHVTLLVKLIPESVGGGISSSPPGTPIPIGLVGFLAFIYLKPKRSFLKAFSM
ncbi:hypothetical protein Tco_1258275 [Tanacetum coccineum]